MSTTPWEVRFSTSKKLPYFFSPQTRESSWTPPPGLSNDEVLALPGAKEYLMGATAGAGAGSGGEEQVRSSHLLIKHAGSRRPASWKNPNITLPHSQALSLLTTHETHLRSLPPNELPSAFAKLASTESDCSSHAKGGDLGWFGRRQMQKPFEDATYNLKIGEMSPIIETDSGVHLILRTG